MTRVPLGRKQPHSGSLLQAELVRQSANGFLDGDATLASPVSPDRLAPQVSALGRVDQKVVALGTHDDHCGLHMIDVRNPAEPVFLGCFADGTTGRARTGYSHDAQCVIYQGPDEDYQGREICFGANGTALSIADVTDRENPVAIARGEYPNVGYAHQGWLTEDHRHFFMGDELDEVQGGVERTRTLVWDVADLDDPLLLKEHFADGHDRPQPVRAREPSVPREPDERAAGPRHQRCGESGGDRVFRYRAG